ncbi:S8 family serine peptidase [Nonomuraea zeae]|uniref:PKD domain-containing protein n=1 Tax=Nonomuraea zeae TaxID=1642303 RepID=A0A5S4FI71_9ACTN|nr:S8 family serine peptidase [Nonomuraea zeae]TMR20209.1 PKD domain-containing protein [Nonomuraea zeae]
MRTRTPLLALFTSALALFAASSMTPLPALANAAQETYIVQLNPLLRAAPRASAQDQVARFGGTLMGVYEHAFKGYTARLTEAAAQRLRQSPNVLSVERDAVVTAFPQTTPTGVRRVFGPANPNLDIDGTDDVRIDVDVAVVDTGVDYTHPDLNVVARANCQSGTCTNNAGTDDNGHGSHVAGIVGAIDNSVGSVGVAPGARIHGVKVLNSAGQGTLAAIAAGLDWVVARASTIEVINLSLGCNGCSSSAISNAITNAVNAGIVVVVAAGNSHVNTSTFFPANHADVVTVSALTDNDGLPGGSGGSTLSCRSETDADDTSAFYSNFGATVEITAPGTCIYSTWMGGGYNTISGTSMASPHVAGAAGILTSGANKPTARAGALAVRSTLISTGNSNWTDDSGDGVKEPLLDVHDATRYPPSTGGNQPPVASYTSSCAVLACSFNGSASTDPDGTIASYAWNFGDGQTGTGATNAHTYAAAGTYTVTLTVTDNQGATGSVAKQVTAGTSANQPPVASFTQTCTLLLIWRYCDFNGSASADPDGTIATYAWTFGDGATGSGATIRHFYTTGGAKTVTLTVTDNQGATNAVTKSVTVP